MGILLLCIHFIVFVDKLMKHVFKISEPVGNSLPDSTKIRLRVTFYIEYTQLTELKTLEDKSF